jgi:hypothetical protein
MRIWSKFLTFTALSLTILGACSFLFGTGSLIHRSWASDKSQLIDIDPVNPDRSIVDHGVRQAVVPRANRIEKPSQLVAPNLGSGDPDVQHVDLVELRELAKTDPKALAVSLPQWVTPLLSDKAYQDVDQLTLSAILARSFDPVTVAAAQHARVLALIAQENYVQALIQAKSYYNVALLSHTGEAVNLLVQILRKTNGVSIANEFEIDQRQGTDHSQVLRTIQIDPKPYTRALQALEKRRDGKGGYSHSSLMAQANLLLISDHLDEAKSRFQTAIKTEHNANKNLRQAVEGLAEVIRAQDDNVADANAFIVSLRENPELAGEALADPGSPECEGLRIAAQQTAISDFTSPVLPALEQLRVQQEKDANASSVAPQVETGFEGSTPVYVATLSPTHLVVEITTPGLRDWFMFRIHGVAGRTVRIDITGAYKTVPEWSQKNWSLNPVYTDAQNLDGAATFSPSMPTKQTIAHNGPVLPDTTGQSWHYISDVWNDAYTLSFVQHFEGDSVYVAMRVPRTPAYNESFLKQLALNPAATVADIGRSQTGRPLLIAQIGTPKIDKPCILLYAQEHADEQDAGWVAQGALEYLASDAPDAADLQNHFTFLVIPMLDPDATAAGVHQAMISSFLVGRTTPESIAYANWFQKWVDRGNRLDLVIDLHNVQSGEGPHVFCPLIEGAGVRGTLSLAVHKMLVENMQEAGYGMRANPQMRGWLPDRLGGWLSHNYGPLSIAYEVNSQAPERHLALAEIKTMGAVFVQTVAQFFASDHGKATLAEVDSRRAQRSAAWADYAKNNAVSDAIVSEANVLKRLDAKDTVEFAENAIP